jgi:ATP-binding cassette, subfamily F, member 3
VGYFTQYQVEELDRSHTPLQHMTAQMKGATQGAVRAQLGRFGFSGNRATTDVGKLSGGERARLALALITRDAPHLLILDEPTNHLDVDAREALVQALNEYEGAVVLVSHDPHLIGLSADRLWLVAEGRCTAFEGDLEDYRRLLLEQRRERAREERAEATNRIESTANKKEKRRQAAEARAQTAHLRKAAAAAEQRLRKLEEKRKALEARLADPDVYGGPTRALMDLQLQFGEIKKQIAAAEEAWLEAEGAREAAEAE